MGVGGSTLWIGIGNGAGRECIAVRYGGGANGEINGTGGDGGGRGGGSSSTEKRREASQETMTSGDGEAGVEAAR